MVAEFRHHGIPIYLKLDAEGADLLALQALEQATSARPHYISLEADIDRLSAVRGQLDALWRLGYRWFQAIQQRYVAGSVLQTTTLNGTPLTHQFEPNASGPFGSDVLGTWLTYDQCIVQFRRIFLRYRTVGHSSLLHKIGGPRVARLARRLTGLQSGWYDIHARL